MRGGGIETNIKPGIVVAVQFRSGSVVSCCTQWWYWRSSPALQRLPVMRLCWKPPNTTVITRNRRCPASNTRASTSYTNWPLPSTKLCTWVMIIRCYLVTVSIAKQTVASFRKLYYSFLFSNSASRGSQITIR